MPTGNTNAGEVGTPCSAARFFDPVSLPEQDKGISFRLIRCSRLVLVVNDGTRPIVVRGRHLQPGGVMPLTNGQVVLLPSGPLSFEDFAFFLDCKRSGKQDVCYISLDGGSLQISRVRSRASEVQIGRAHV